MTFEEMKAIANKTTTRKKSRHIESQIQQRRSAEQTGSRDIEGRRCYRRGSRHDTVKTFGRLCFPLY